MPVSAQKSRLIAGDFNLAAVTKSVSAPYTVDVHDATVITTSGAKEYVAGRPSSTFTVNGVYSAAEHADLASWASAGAQPITYGMSGLSIGSEVWMASGIETAFNTTAPIDNLVAFDLTAQADGLVDFGVVLHDLGAETGDGSATSVDNGAQTTTGAVAHLHVTAFSGFSGAVVTIEDSANNSTWATIGTFATVAAVTSERLVIAGTVRRYIRATVDVTGSGSVTYAVALARR